MAHFLVPFSESLAHGKMAASSGLMPRANRHIVAGNIYHFHFIDYLTDAAASGFRQRFHRRCRREGKVL
jgi:Uri superfamily endonuclease